MNIKMYNEQTQFTIKNELNSLDSERGRNQTGKKKENGQANKIFAGDINIMTDSIEEKKKKAQKDAMKLVSEQFKSDCEMDDSFQKMSDRIDELWKQSGDAKKEIDALNVEKEKLKGDYGIEDDSQEQKDLELLEKAATPDYNTDFTEAESERLKYLQMHPEERTEYQQAVLGRDTSISLQKKVIDNSMRELIGINAGVRGVKLERLKSEPMMEVQKITDIIQEKVNDEIIGMVIDETKDTIDDNLDMEKEKAQKAEAEKQELERKIEDAKEDNVAESNESNANAEDLADTTEVLSNAEQLQEDVQAGIKEIIEKQKVLAEDLKGISVDEML